jgi:hypothetical protein
LLVVAFFLLKVVVDACLGLLATRQTATRAPEQLTGHRRRSLLAGRT